MFFCAAVIVYGLLAAPVSIVAGTSVEAFLRETIHRPTALSESEITAIDTYLLNATLPEYFSLREVLIGLPTETLYSLQEEISEFSSGKFSELLNRILEEKEKKSIYLLEEDIYIDNKPSSVSIPLSGTVDNKFKITNLPPEEENLHLNRLQMQYRENKLVQKTETLWVGLERAKIITGKSSTGKRSGMVDKGQLSFKSKQVPAQKAWSYQLASDNQTDYLINMRQWIKKYEEEALYPVNYQDTIILRNEHRLYGLDAFSKDELWSFKCPDEKNEEFYQTFKDPHHNSFGYQFLIEQNMVFTGLGKKLIAARLRGDFLPVLLWEVDLGEFKICTKPVLNGRTLCLGLINSKGELWLVGFDHLKGVMLWSTYIGITSFLSPACEISALKNDLIFMGTNCGVIVCLEAKQGDILWIKKYTPKSYSLFDFWSKHTFPERNAVVYDTQFMNFDAEDNLLYYKPRESDYLYILNPENGESKLEMFVDTNNFYLLWSGYNRALFLERLPDKNYNVQIRVIELVKGSQIGSLAIPSGQLKGVFSAAPHELSLKIGKTVYSLAMGSDSIVYSVSNISTSSWLLGYQNGLLFAGESGKLTVFDFPHKTIVPLRSIPQLKPGEVVKKDLFVVSEFTPANEQAFYELCQKITTDSVALETYFDKLSPVIINNFEALKQSKWKEILVKFAQVYGNKIIKYQGISMKFINFLSKSGLIDTLPALSNKQQLSPVASTRESFSVQADKIFPLPLKVVRGEVLPDFILILRGDQLISVNEAQEVLWERKLFYLPYPLVNYNINYTTDRCTGRMYADDIQAYYYEGVVIINDHVNIIAVDAQDGSYLWSMTNTGEEFQAEKQLPLKKFDKLYEKYGLHRPFLKQIMFHTNFLNDKLFITHGNTIYAVDPLTGYPEKQSQINSEGIMRVDASAGRIYALSYSLDYLKVFDINLVSVANFRLSFIKNQNVYPEILFMDKYIILQAGAEIYLLDKLTGKLKDVIKLDAAKEYYLEVFQKNLLLIAPSEEITSYAVVDGSFKVIWASLFDAEDTILWKYRERKTNRYFLLDQKILMPVKRAGEYFISAIELTAGNKLWETPIPDVTGFLYDLSNCINFNGTAIFILVTEWHGADSEGQPDSSLKELISVRPILVWLRLADGMLTILKPLVAINEERLIQSACITETPRCFIYGINRKIVRIERNEHAPDNR